MTTVKNTLFRTLNKLLPKLNRIVVSGSNTAESNAIEFANFIAENNKRRVYFLVSKEFRPYIQNLVSTRIVLINNTDIQGYYMLLTTKYIFSTHGSSLAGSSKRQKEINLWHGLLYKNIRILRGESGLNCDITVGTSPLSQKMFSEAFGVPIETIFIAGYPRNDMMIRAQSNQKRIKDKLTIDLSSFDKIVFWMPTYRRKELSNRVEGTYNMQLDNPFEVDNFDVASFNALLKEKDTLCLLKPHYFYMSKDYDFEYSNIKMIDDVWILSQGITLYQLLACSDILISDFSSVIYDYTLLNKPIVCFCTDLEEYKQKQGLYFDDIENWLPSKLIQKEKDFFFHLSILLDGEKDPYEDKRRKVKNVAFTFHDANSSKRLMDYVFEM